MYDKSIYVIQMRTLKQALNHELILKKVRRVIKFNQKAWLKPSIDINTELRTKLSKPKYHATNRLQKMCQQKKCEK